MIAISTIIDGLDIMIWLCLGVVAVYTDLRWGKVLNKHLLFFLFLGIFVKSFQLYEGFEYARTWMLGIATGGGMALFLYGTKSWAAGDAKFYITLLLLTPCRLVKWLPRDLPGFSILIYVFSLGYFYLLAETMYLIIRNIRELKSVRSAKLKGLNGHAIRMVLVRLYLSYSLSGLLQLILFKLIPNFYQSYRGVFVLAQVFVLIGIIKWTAGWKTRNLLLASTLCFVITQISVFSEGRTLSLTSLFVVAAVAAVRMAGQLFNYQRLPVEELRAGMVLSYDSVIGFYGSKVRGLPSSTTESPKSRLNEEEVQSIFRWSQSKRGESHVRIVRHMPFAPFIFFGMILQLTLQYFNII